MKLHISDDISLPPDAVTQTFAILAKRGTGKTYTASVLAEEMLKAGHQIVALDPTGAWWGLRSAYKVVIFGGEHADVPLEESAGEVVAQAIVEHGFSAVIDLSLFRKGQMIRFMVAFAETLYRLNRTPLHLFVDEADAVAPQSKNYGGDENRMLGAMEDIVRRGRKRGIGCTLITQRPAVINKNVLTQCEVLVAMRLVHPKDIDAIEEWVNVHADPVKAKDMIASLPSLPIGTAWLWSPGWGDIFKRIAIRQRETFDSGATPKPGEKVQRPKSLREIDLSALGDQIKATVERAKENNPSELKRTIADLKKKLASAPEMAAEVKAERIEVPILDDAAKRLLEKVEQACERYSQAGDHFKTLTNQLSQLRVEIQGKVAASHFDSRREIKLPVAERFYREKPQEHSNGEVSGGMRRMMIALAQRNGLTKKQLGVRAGLSSTSGTFGTYLGKLRSSGYVQGSEPLEITSDGLKALGHYEPLPEGQDLLRYWLDYLGSSGAGRMLAVLSEAYPKTLTKQELGERADISPSSGTFGTYLGKLRTLELVEGRSELMASKEFFE